MIRFTTFILLFFIVQACQYHSQNFDYDLQNKRFDYSSSENFKNSIISHFNNDTNQFDLIKLEDLEISKSTKNDLILFIESKNHEVLIEKFPNKIFNFILYLKENNASEKIVFESTQTYLRFLTRDKILR